MENTKEAMDLCVEHLVEKSKSQVEEISFYMIQKLRIEDQQAI